MTDTTRDKAVSRVVDLALAEQWCNGCRRPRREWGPVCPGMTSGDWTHYHSPEFWLAYAAENPAYGPGNPDWEHDLERERQ
jgi:hypothetical protein